MRLTLEEIRKMLAVPASDIAEKVHECRRILYHAGVLTDTEDMRIVDRIEKKFGKPKSRS